MRSSIIATVLAITMATFFVSCKKEIKKTALQVTSSGLAEGLGPSLSCSDIPGFSNGIKVELSKLSIFDDIKTSQEKSIIGQTICSASALTLVSVLKDQATATKLLQSGKCSLEKVNNLSLAFVVETCQKIKF